MPVPRAIAQVLEEAGIDLIFGIPGGRTGAIFDALYDYRDSIRTVLVREEGLAAVMADVYGRLTGNPGVAMGQGAFLLTNSGMGILEAFLAGSPMLLLSDLSDGAPFSHHGPYQAGTGDYGTWDAKTSIGGYTKQVFVAREGAQAVQDTQLAIKHALAGQPAPVAVLYHSGALTASVGPDTAPRLYATATDMTGRTSAVGAGQVEAAAHRPASRCPTGHHGRQWRSHEPRPGGAAQPGRALDAPVATTASGKGVFAETHPLALGVFGTFGLEAANAVVAEADLMLAVGTKLGPTDTANENPALLDPARQTFIQIDIEPRNAAWTFPAEHVLIGDAAAVLSQLVDELGTAEPASPNGRASRAPEAHRLYQSFEVPESRSTETPILPQRLIKDLRDALPDDAIVTCDAGENRLFMMHHFKTKPAWSICNRQPSAAWVTRSRPALAAQAGVSRARCRRGVRRRRIFDRDERLDYRGRRADTDRRGDLQQCDAGLGPPRPAGAADRFSIRTIRLRRDSAGDGLRRYPGRAGGRLAGGADGGARRQAVRRWSTSPPLVGSPSAT